MSRTIWLTGLSASGKSTIARGLSERLSSIGISCQVIDGDELRQGLCADLGYSRADRKENLRRAAEICRSINASGVVVIVALISPYREDRDMARRIVGEAAFSEVFLSAPLDVCERRDPKGLYRRARAGEIVGFSGVSDPYEPPLNPHLVLETHFYDAAECVSRIVALMGAE